MSAGNPVVSGLLQAMQLANIIQNQRMQREQLAIAKQREQRYQQVQEEESLRQQAKLQADLNALGARPMTPSDELATQTGVEMFGPGPFGPLFRESTVSNRTVNLGKNGKWVLPSEDEQEARKDREAKRVTNRKVAETTATTEAAEKAKTNALKTRLETLGIPVSDEHAELLGMPKGAKILPENQDDLLRAVIAKTIFNSNPVQSTRVIADEKGQHVVTTHKDGTVKKQETFGAKPTPKPAAPKPRAATPAQQATEKLKTTANRFLTEAGNDAAKAEELVKKSADPYVANNRIDLIGQVRKAAPKPAAKTNDPAAALRQMEEFLNGGKPSKGKATADQIRRFARREGISYQEAQRRVKAEGFETPE